MEKAYFAAGCFWGVEDTFMKTEGVSETSVGYMGGFDPSPTYKKVCAGNSGHAETVEVIFDSTIISFTELLGIFFSCHNPTTLNRQGPDIGSQYRSAVFTLDQKQFDETKNYIEKLTQEKAFSNPIVTQVEMAKEYFLAEGYHQQYFLKNGGGSCKL